MASAAGRHNGVLDILQRIAPPDEGPERSDADLLGCFVSEGNAGAFEALIRRHGPMVLGVCRRILGNEADADDAFQATFLVLVRKAASIRPRRLVGHWLYGVAYRTAKKARAMSDKRRSMEARARRPEATEVSRSEWIDVLDDELSRLPEKFRTIVVLCELQGKTLAQAAELLGCPVGTVASRLARGRDLLGQRLRDRGMTVSGAGLAAVLSGNTGGASVSGALVTSTGKAAMLFAAGESMAGGAVSTGAAVLAEGVLKAMLLSKITSVGVLLVLVAIACGAGTVTYRALADDGGNKTEATQARKSSASAGDESRKARKAAPPAPSPRDELQALAKRWQERGAKYAALVKKETSFEKIRELSKRLLPAHDTAEVEAFFDLEKRNRGKDVGYFALNFIFTRAAQYGDPDLPLVKGCDRALVILREHYVSHADLDVTFGSLRWGPMLFGGEEFLKAVAEKSPHEYVRAAALYYWADLIKFKMEYLAHRKGSQRPKASESPRDKWLEEEKHKTLQRLKGFDENAARKEAERLAKRVLVEYPKAVSPLRLVEPESPYMPKRYERKPVDARVQQWRAKRGLKPVNDKIPTWAELAQALLFDLTRLNVGQPAPAIEGSDALEKPFRLSDCKGRVVVLMFSANWCGPCKHVYPTLRELQKMFKGKPFEVVTVMADHERKTVREATDKGDITWRAVWDGDRGPIVTKWNVHSFPSLFVIDQRGIIRSRDPQEETLAERVAELLKEGDGAAKGDGK